MAKNFLRIKSPVGGMVRSTAYQQQPPFTNYASINMWPIDALTDRNVIATRPPLATITSPTGPCTLLCRVNGFATGKPYQSFIGGFNSDVYYWNGTAFVAATGAQASDIPTTRAVYAATYLEDVFICQTSSKPLVFDYDGATVTTLVETAGTAPSDCRFNAVWQGAVWYSGQLATPHLLHATRVGFPLDFDTSGSIDDIGRAFSTTSSENEGRLNGPVTALMPQTSDVMIVSTIEGLVAMRGHPHNNGIFDPIDGTHYVLGHGAWCKTPGDYLYMLNPLGLAVLPPGVNQVVTQLSRKKIPGELLGIDYDYDDPKVAMCYDAKWNGIHITIRGVQQQAWFYDLANGGFHRMEFPGYPFVMMEFPPFGADVTANTNGVLYGGTLLRHMDKFGSESIESSVTIGPIQLTENSTTKARIDRCRVILARDTPNDNTDTSTLSIAVGTDGQDAVNHMELGTHQYEIGLDKVKLYHGMCLPQVSGHAAVFTVEQSNESFGIEEIELVVAPSGWNKSVRSDQIAVEGDETDFSVPDDEFDADDWHGYAEATPNTPNCTLTDHTLFIDLSRMPADWWDAVQSGIGGDVRATTNTNDQIPIDIIYFDAIERTGFATVKLTQQDPPTPVRIWVGNPDVGPEAVDSTFGQYNAYDSNWRAFWPSGGARDDGELDRTQNLNHITLVNQVTSANLVAGTIGVEATDYVAVDATNNYGIANTSVPAAAYPITLIVVAKDEDATSLPCLGFRDAAATAANVELTVNRTATHQRADAGSTNTSAVADEATSDQLANSANFRHFTATITSATLRTAYIDGGNDNDSTTNIVIADGTLDDFIIGKGSRAGLSAASTTADLCLAQVHDTARSACWINYQEQMLDQEDFWDDWIWFEENPPDEDDDPVEVGTWSGYAQATPLTPSATQPSWVHWIDLSRLPAEWWAAVDEDGVDIRATNSLNKFIAFDLVEFDHDAETGFACVKLTQGATLAQPIKLWVGNTSAITIAVDDRYGQYNVYDSGWKGFWPAGSGSDRTRNQNTITLVSATSGGATGPIGNTATTYDGVDDYGYVIPSVAGRIPPNEPFLLSAAVKPANITSKMASVSLNRSVFLGHSTLVHDISSTPVMLEVRADSQIAVATSDVTVTPPSTWYHTVGWARDNRRRGCIVNGDGPDAATEQNIHTHDYTRLSIGARLSGTDPTVYWPFNGDISLVQVHNTIRALDNAWADYQSEMLTQATFWDTDWAWTAEVSSLPQ
jgi:hypothetical protein